MLTNACKEEVFFNNIQNFKNNYVDKIFKSKKNYSIQSWINSNYYTYRVRIIDDILATGQASLQENAIEDYYTIIKEDNQFKISINGYIARESIGALNQNEQIKVEVVEKDIYKEYEKYTIKVTNNTTNVILLDSRQNTQSVYLKDKNDKKYQAFMYEVIDTKLVIQPNQSKQMQIRFNKIYSNKAQIKQMVLEDIILDYETYKTIQNKEEYTNRSKITVDI